MKVATAAIPVVAIFFPFSSFGALPRPSCCRPSETAQSSLRAVPAVGRNVEHDAIRISKLVFGILRHVRRGAGMGLAAVRFDRPCHRLDVVDPDTEVMQPDEVFTAFV